jgi:Protein of unknown function (DUF1656)
MFPALRDIDIYGLFVSPATIALIASLIPSIVFHFLISSRDLDRIVWNRALVEVVMFFIFFALAVLTLSPG